MSTVTPLIDHVEDLWPGDVPQDTLGQLVLASHLLGANRAVSNFGGGNTSAKGVTTDHAGREVVRDVGQGLRLRPRDDGAGALHGRCGWTRCCR